MLYGWLLTTALGVAIFLVFARYRLPLVPVLLLFASAGLIELVQVVRLRQYRRLAATGLVGFALALPANASWGWLDQIRAEQSGTAYANVGLAFREDGDQTQAVQYLRNALKFDPRNTAASINLGNALLSLGQTQEAVAAFRTGLAVDPDSPDLNYNLGYALDRSAKSADAISPLRRAAALSPNYLPAQSLLGQILVTEGLFDEAVAHYQSAILANPKSADLRFAASQLFEMGRAYELATKELIYGIQIDPTSRYEWDRLISLLMKSGSHRDAVRTAKTAAGKFPDDLELRNRLAWLLATSPDDGSRDGLEALKLARSVMDATEGKNIHSLDSMAAALAELGRFAEAGETIDRAIGFADSIDHPIGDALRSRKRLYESGQAYRYSNVDPGS
jgi:tetratricopeptide (TPR) repeat protein